jgi:hypothetical protein
VDAKRVGWTRLNEKPRSKTGASFAAKRLALSAFALSAALLSALTGLLRLLAGSALLATLLARLILTSLVLLAALILIVLAHVTLLGLSSNQGQRSSPFDVP